MLVMVDRAFVLFVFSDNERYACVRNDSFVDLVFVRAVFVSRVCEDDGCSAQALSRHHYMSFLNSDRDLSKAPQPMSITRSTTMGLVNLTVSSPRAFFLQTSNPTPLNRCASDSTATTPPAITQQPAPPVSPPTSATAPQL